MTPRAIQFLTLGFLCLAPLLGQKPVMVKGKSQPTALVEQPWVIGSEVIRHWKDLPNQVNAPTNRTRVYPGQHLTIAVAAQGDGRDQLLKEGTYSFTVSVGAETKSFDKLRPLQTRRILSLFLSL